MLRRPKRPKPPAHLLKPGKTFWQAVADEYALDDVAGLALLTAASECLDRMRAAQAAIEKHGEVVTDRYGQVKVNPACALEKDSRNGFLAAVRAMNLDLEPLHPTRGRPAGTFG